MKFPEAAMNLADLVKVYQAIQNLVRDPKVTIEVIKDPECGGIEQLIKLHLPSEYDAKRAHDLTCQLDNDLIDLDLKYTVHIEFS